MAREEVDAVRWTCDGCGSYALADADSGLPAGFVFDLTLTAVDAERSEYTDVYACRIGCVRKAIKTLTGARDPSEPVEGQVSTDDVESENEQ